MDHNQEREQNQQAFREILTKYGLTQAQAAAMITIETGQKVGARKIRSWLADPKIPSSRTCPTWVLTALKRATKNLSANDGDKS